ncbi:MAG: S-layer homology domain-containing protein [Ruminococcaceae bacterium]|nr:S-layer homology domain-containing protein [Oscillospiraceae bacterium]
MKRLMCVMLSLMMVMMLLPTTFAAEDSELTKIVKIAKGRLQIPEEFTEFYSNEYDAVGQKSYELRWSTEDSKKRINVSVLFDGEILSYSYNNNDYDYDRKGFAPFDKAEYTKLAKEWIERVNPTYTPEISEDVEVNIGSIYSTSVSVTFNREKNGIEVDGNYVRISLDKFTGEVLSMYSNWTREQNIKSPEGVITKEEAAKILGEKSELKLRYYKLRDENRAVLMYTPENSYMMIDAFTGEDFTVEFIDAELGATTGGAGGGAAEAPMADNAAKEEAEVELSEKEIEAVEELESLLTKEALTGIIRRMANTEIATFDVKTVDYRRVEIKGKMTYIATVRLEKDNNMSGSVTFDAKTGELHSFSTYLPYRYNKKQNVKYDRMESNAMEFMRTWAPAIAGKAKNFDEYQNSEYFYFTHNENGIEYRGNSVNMRVDKETGKILSFSKSWDTSTTFDSPEGILNVEEATAKYTEAAPPELLYIANKRVRYASNNAEELALIYRLPHDAPSYIDAKTGAAYDWNMGQMQEENPDAYVLQKDIKGHWAEEVIKILAENGIVLSYEEEFRPDEAITQKEIALLITCFEGNARPYAVPESEYTAYIDRMVRRGIIKENEKNPNKKITREETVTYLVRLFGYESAAELSGIFKTGFSDEAAISPDKIGYVAIAKALKLVKGNGGKFNPKNNVTRAELAMMLYNALTV